MSKIINLEVNNIKRVKAVSINADGTMNVISGKNGNGKSSTLDAIEMALRGTKFVPDMPVRAGENDARIVIETEELTVTRHWTNPETSYLKVVHKEFGKMANGQTALDLIVGNLSFDPLEFSSMEPKKRVAILKEITKLDFTELDKEYKEKFAERTGVKRDADAHAATISTFLPHELTKPEFNVEEIKKKREEANAHNSMIDRLRDVTIPNWEKALNQHSETIGNEDNEIKKLQRQIESISKDIADRYNKIADAQASYKTCEEELERSKKQLEEAVTMETDKFDSMIQEHANYEAGLKIAKQREEVVKKKDEAQMKAAALTDRLEEILAEKSRLLSEAKMPIEGLSFADNDVIFNDVPFIQLSTSEQIQISMSIAMALNPKLRIIIIKNGSLLDSEAMKKIYDLAEKNDFQVWVEKVADSPDGNSIFISEGEVLHVGE